MKEIDFSLNGEKIKISVAPYTTLLKAIRDLGLTGTKEGCDEGECGACTVLIQGQPVNACLYLAINAQGKEIVTIEGLASGGELHKMQESFIRAGAIQCGYCTPGMVLTAKALLDINPNPTEKDIRTALVGNLCRCTGYAKIVEAVKMAAKDGGGD